MLHTALLRPAAAQTHRLLFERFFQASATPDADAALLLVTTVVQPLCYCW
jgi:hypothetical protein